MMGCPSISDDLKHTAALWVRKVSRLGHLGMICVGFPFVQLIGALKMHLFQGRASLRDGALVPESLNVNALRGRTGYEDFSQFDIIVKPVVLFASHNIFFYRLVVAQR